MIRSPMTPHTPPEWLAYLASLTAQEIHRTAMIYAGLHSTKGPMQ